MPGARVLVEVDRAKEVAVIGECDGRESEPGALDQPLQARRAIEEAVLRVDVEVDEVGPLGHGTRPSWAGLPAWRRVAGSIASAAPRAPAKGPATSPSAPGSPRCRQQASNRRAMGASPGSG